MPGWVKASPRWKRGIVCGYTYDIYGNTVGITAGNENTATDTLDEYTYNSGNGRKVMFKKIMAFTTLIIVLLVTVCNSVSCGSAETKKLRIKSMSSGKSYVLDSEEPDGDKIYSAKCKLEYLYYDLEVEDGKLIFKNLYLGARGFSHFFWCSQCNGYRQHTC